MKTLRQFFWLLIPLTLLGVTGINSGLALVAVVVLWLGLHLLWRKNISPILFFVFAYQWLQASVLIFKANYEGISIASLHTFNGQMTQAIILSLISLSFLALGMRQGIGRGSLVNVAMLRAQVVEKPPEYWFKVFALFWIISILAPIGSTLIPGLRQVFLAFTGLKWAFFWVFTYAIFNRGNTPRKLWWIVFFSELVLSFGGFFSDFKTILIVTLLAVIPAGVRLRPARLMGLVGLIAIALYLGVVWTAVKDDYRRFLNKGENAQVVLVGINERYTYLTNAITDLDSTTMRLAFDNMLDRISYIGFFALVLDEVPARMDHEYGAVWGDAMLRPFMPRIIFSGKSAINDSDFTSKYTGGNVVGEGDQATSISIGYIGESYIDFGHYLMMAPIFLLGLIYGKFYKWMCNYRNVQGVIGMGLATSVLLPAAVLETSITKLVGGLVVSALVAWLVARLGTRYLRGFEQ